MEEIHDSFYTITKCINIKLTILIVPIFSSSQTQVVNKLMDAVINLRVRGWRSPPGGKQIPVGQWGIFKFPWAKKSIS